MFSFNDTDRYDTTKYTSDFNADKLASLKRSVILKVVLVGFISAVAMLAVMVFMPSGKKFIVGKEDVPVAVGAPANAAPMNPPRIVDNTFIITGNKLKKTLNEYYDLAGISVEFNTVYDEDWKDSYSSLDQYNESVYRLNIHFQNDFVMMFSVSRADLELVEKGELEKPHYQWSIIYDNILTRVLDDAFDKGFNNALTENIMDKGMAPEEAVAGAFEFAIEDAKAKYAAEENDMRTSKIIKIVCCIVISVAALVIIILMLKKYSEDKNAVMNAETTDPAAGKSDQ